jgi:hypothetical protein
MGGGGVYFYIPVPYREETVKLDLNTDGVLAEKGNSVKASKIIMTIKLFLHVL